jgi:hypothetical protein
VPILAAIADRPPDYVDDFSDPGSGWYVGTRTTEETGGWETGEAGYEDGEYFIVVDSGSAPGEGGKNAICMTGDWSWLPTFPDLVPEVDVRFVSDVKKTVRGDMRMVSISSSPPLPTPREGTHVSAVPMLDK